MALLIGNWTEALKEMLFESIKYSLVAQQVLQKRKKKVEREMKREQLRTDPEVSG